MLSGTANLELSVRQRWRQDYSFHVLGSQARSFADRKIPILERLCLSKLRNVLDLVWHFVPMLQSLIPLPGDI